MILYKMIRKDKDGNIEVFYANLQTKQLLDSERKKERRLNALIHLPDNTKKALRTRQRVASELRRMKIARKELLS